jgi:hypothetical protein
MFAPEEQRLADEKRIDSPVVGCREGRAASSSRRLELPSPAGRQQGSEDLKTQTWPSHGVLGAWSFLPWLSQGLRDLPDIVAQVVLRPTAFGNPATFR